MGMSLPLLAWLLLAAPEAASTPENQVTAPPAKRGRPPAPTAARGLEAGAEPDDLAGLGLRRLSDGTYLYRDPGNRFSAYFHPDGSVNFADRWRRPSDLDTQNGKCCALPGEGLAAINPFYGVPLGGPLEWLLKASGHDLSTKAKMELLERTAEVRTKLAISWTLQNLKERLAELEPQLLQAWSDRSVPGEDRRKLLFALWDECDEFVAIDTSQLPPDAITTIDEARQDTAEEARRRIEAFIRRHAPRGSESGYTARELRQFNETRRSTRPFAPYSPAAKKTARDR